MGDNFEHYDVGIGDPENSKGRRENLTLPIHHLRNVAMISPKLKREEENNVFKYCQGGLL